MIHFSWIIVSIGGDGEEIYPHFTSIAKKKLRDPFFMLALVHFEG
jgi:hypothetical protein